MECSLHMHENCPIKTNLAPLRYIPTASSFEVLDAQVRRCQWSGQWYEVRTFLSQPTSPMCYSSLWLGAWMCPR